LPHGQILGGNENLGEFLLFRLGDRRGDLNGGWRAPGQHECQEASDPGNTGNDQTGGFINQSSEQMARGKAGIEPISSSKPQSMVNAILKNVIDKS